jgi:NCAIR mutase (PurE)-related protein
MRNRDLLGAKSTKDLLDVLNDISAGIGPVNVDKSVGAAN